MIGENIKIVDWSVDQWQKVYHALFHRSAPKTTIAVIHKDGVPIKFIDSQAVSRSNLQELYTDGQSMDELIKTIHCNTGVDVVYAISYPVIRTIFAEFQRTVNFEDDYVKQLFALKDAIAHEVGQGILRYPAGLQWLADLEYKTVRKLFRAVPDDALVMLTVFGEEDIWTNWIIGVEGGTINLITTLETVKPDVRLITDWRREHKLISNAVKEWFGVKPIAFFTDESTFKKLLGSKSKFRFILDALSTKKIISKAMPIKYRILLILRRIFGRRKRNKKYEI